ncbi:hypothetical protein MTR_8g466560 [Medicago truncatula]|uniref:Uncharacterized protein n=1 Tax=Medicago truncatula TaxID=3880 RepID=A0A072TQK3_MEDTR|nr:hypothetical protein MTR_8g466560 [Medicago truncatula]
MSFHNQGEVDLNFYPKSTPKWVFISSTTSATFEVLRYLFDLVPRHWTPLTADVIISNSLLTHLSLKKYCNSTWVPHDLKPLSFCLHGRNQNRHQNTAIFLEFLICAISF